MDTEKMEGGHNSIIRTSVAPKRKIATTVMGIHSGGRTPAGEALHESGFDGTPFVVPSGLSSKKSGSFPRRPKIGILVRASKSLTDPLESEA